MSLAIVHSRASNGIQAPAVTVEAHISNGLPGFSIVGLPETVVKESRDRVRSALLNAHFDFPARRITVNLAPADLPKDGGRFDLPIALGILAASGQLPINQLYPYEFAGELALSGDLRPIHGTLPFALATRDAKRQLILPTENAQEASLPKQLCVLPAAHLLEVCGHLLGVKLLDRYPASALQFPATIHPDLAEVHGQLHAKRALEIAAAGQHNLLLIGPPGTGKTMLATRLPGLLPAMTEQEAIESAAVISIAGKVWQESEWLKRPFRAPHHTASSVALVGGGSPPTPGEISLAHHGILFLDELPEFNRNVLEALREPLESGCITISRASHQVQFPAKFQLIATMNPCPCGYLSSPEDRCRCSSEKVQRYVGRISGPLLDRLDMQVEVPALPKGFLTNRLENPAENSNTVRTRVIRAREVQQQRNHGKANALLTPPEIEKFCQVSAESHSLLEQAMERFGLSVRAYHRTLKVARTIADLADSSNIHPDHISESLSYRKRGR